LSGKGQREAEIREAKYVLVVSAIMVVVGLILAFYTESALQLIGALMAVFGLVCMALAIATLGRVPVIVRF